MSVGHILVVPTHEIRREDAGVKWCFQCRKRLPHEFVVHLPDDRMSYYGPHWTFACSGCGGDHVDFPGTWAERAWASDDEAVIDEDRDRRAAGEFGGLGDDES